MSLDDTEDWTLCTNSIKELVERILIIRNKYIRLMTRTRKSENLPFCERRKIPIAASEATERPVPIYPNPDGLADLPSLLGSHSTARKIAEEEHIQSVPSSVERERDTGSSKQKKRESDTDSVTSQGKTDNSNQIKSLNYFFLCFKVCINKLL